MKMINKSLCFDCPVSNCKVKSRGNVEFCSAKKNWERGKRNDKIRSV
jgi:hypothetical protein